MSYVMQLAFAKLTAARTDAEVLATADTIQALQRLEKLKEQKR